MEQLLKPHASCPYNPNIANAFFRAGMIESWGRGIQRIVAACEDAGVEIPGIALDGSGLSMTFGFEQQVDGGVSGVTTQETTPKKILVFLRAEPTLTRKAMAERLGLSPDGVKYHLDRLRKAGMIRHVGPTKGGYWEVLL